MIIAFGGMRTGEITNALVSEFDFESMLWSIAPERTKTSGGTFYR